jgi:hypothetical protein
MAPKLSKIQIPQDANLEPVSLSARSSRSTTGVATSVMDYKPKRAPRTKAKAVGPVLSAPQRAWAKESEAELQSFVWNMRISDLKLFIRLMRIGPAPEDARIDTKDSAVRAVFAYLAALEEEDEQPYPSASGSAGPAGGETQAPPAVPKVPMAPVVHAHPANILFFWFLFYFCCCFFCFFWAHDHVPGPRFIQPGARFKTNFVTNMFDNLDAMGPESSSEIQHVFCSLGHALQGAS